MNEKQTYLDWKFWHRWVLFSTLGYGFGGITSWFIVNFGGWFFYPSFLTFVFLGGAVAGASVGLAQWQAIRLKAPQANKLMWLAGNIVGLAICWTIFYWVMNTRDFNFLVTGVIGAIWGLLSAVIQWYTLQGQIHRAAIWFPLNSVFGLVVFCVGWAWPTIVSVYTNNPGIGVDQLLYFSVIGLFIAWPIAGLLYGLMSGRLLIWLLGQSNQPDGSDEHVLAG